MSDLATSETVSPERQAVGVDSPPEAFFESLFKDNPELSSLPQTLAQIISVAGKETASIDDLSRVVQVDPGLSARLLRAANSAYCGRALEVTSVPQAVQTLGFRAVLSFALTTSIYRLTEALSGGLSRERFWRHSLETAVAARLLAESIEGVDPDEAFVSGLLHDLGMLVFDHSFTREYREVLNEVESGSTLCELEVARWGATHASAGMFLLRQWHIPESIAEAVGFHHLVPTDISKKKISKLSLCVALANTFSRQRMFDRSGDTISSFERRVAVTEALGLDQDTICEVEERLAAEFFSQAEFMQIEVGDATALALAANAALYRQYLAVSELLERNKKLQEKMVREKTERRLLQSLHAISGTYHHYLNNATATIQGKSQILKIKYDLGEITDTGETLEKTVVGILKCVEVIGAVLKAIEEVTTVETTKYHDEVEIMDIEKRLRERRGEIERMVTLLDCSKGVSPVS